MYLIIANLLSINFLMEGNSANIWNQNKIITSESKQESYWPASAAKMEGLITYKAIKSLESYSVKTILDVGTGRGEFIPILKESFQAFEKIIGIDINETSLEEAKHKYIDDNITFLNMCASKMSFEDGSFDVVCISNTLHYLPIDVLTRILLEMKRVLKEGSLFIINEMYCDNQSEKQMSHVKTHHLNAQIDEILGNCHR